MAWFGEGLSTLKGQLQHFTKEVLAEGRDDSDASAVSQLSETQQKVQELEALCASQELEIAALRQQNAQLLRRDSDPDPGPQAEDSGGNASTWWTVEHRCDTAYNNGTQQGSRVPNGARYSPGAQEIQERELKEKEQLVELLQGQLAQLEQDKLLVSKTCASLEEQLHKLKNQHQSEVVQLQDQLQLGSTMNEQLLASESRVEELEEQLHQVQQQLWDHLSNSQTNASELRSEVEHTRWQLLQESGTQKTELLRARQDMVNRIIQMGEKSREVELNVRKLKAEGQHLSADIAAIIHKLGDPEQQELIHGALNALELENQVLKLRNAQLELAGTTDTLKDSVLDVNCKGDESNKSVGSDVAEHNSKYFDVGMSKTEDDFDTVSVKSDFSELSTLKQKLETQVSELKGQVEMYKRDIKHYEMVKLDWSEEKDSLEKHLSELKEQLRDKQDNLSLVTAQKGLLALKQQSPENEEIQRRVEELTAALTQVQEERDQISAEKTFVLDEVEAMARVVQDLEAQLASAQEEKSTLSRSLEELDQQHQDAIEQVLNVKKSLQSQNETLKSEIKALQQKLESVSKENQTKCEEKTVMKLDVVSMKEDRNDIASCGDKMLSYEEFKTKYASEFKEKYASEFKEKYESEVKEKYESEFEAKVLKVVTFEIPKEYSSNGGMVEALAKCCNEWKWKKDTLERKVAELMKTGRDAEVRIGELEHENSVLRGNVEALVEELMGCKDREGEGEVHGLAPIPESSEERIAALENEVEVLREVRSNLEAENARLNEVAYALGMKLRTAEASLLNQENLEIEVTKWQKVAATERQQLDIALQAKSEAQKAVEFLKERIKTLESSLQEMSRRGHKTATNVETLPLNTFQDESSGRVQIDCLHKRVNELELVIADHQSELNSCIEELRETQHQQKDALHAEASADAQCKGTQNKQQERGTLERVLQLQKALRNKIQNMQQKLQNSESLFDNHKALQTKDIKWKEIATNAEQKLQEILETKVELEKQCSSLQASLNHQLDFNSNTGRQYQELQLKNKQQSDELESLNVLINTKEQHLSETLQSLSKYAEELSSMQSKFSNKETQCEQLRKEKGIVEQELHEVVKAKVGLESNCEQLQCKLTGMEQLVAELQASVGSLEQALRETSLECQRCSSLELELQNLEAARQEAQSWRVAAEATERQLEEAVMARAELEQECGRLFAVETRVHRQEHLEREIARQATLIKNAENDLERASNMAKQLEEQRYQLQCQLVEQSALKQEITQLRQLVNDKEQQLQRLLQTTNELETKCQNLQNIASDRDHLQQEASQWKDLAESTQQKLDKMLDSKTELECENKRLQTEAAISKNQEQELKEKIKALHMEFNTVSHAKLQLDEEYRRLKRRNRHFGHKVEDVHDMNTEKIDTGKEALQKDEKDLDDSENCVQKVNAYLVTESDVSELKMLQDRSESLEAERLCLVSALDDKARENRLLQTENEHLLELFTAEKAVTSNLQEERNKLLTEHQFQSMETSAMAKETIHNLSKIIKDKDLEIETLVQKCESLTADDSERMTRLQAEREELIHMVHAKYQESVQYHGEIQRLNALLNEELARAGQAAQELEQLRSRQAAETKEKELKARGLELDTLREQILAMQQEAAAAAAAKQPQQQDKDLHEECVRLSESLKQAQAKIKYLESEVKERQDKELERLRLHLVAVEESYTLEAIRSEEQMKELQSKLQQAEEIIKNSSTAYTSASIRANQQVETLQGQARLIAQQRDEVQRKLSAAEDQVHKHAAALRNLQVVLEQFQKDKEREIAAATHKVYEQVEAARRKHEELLAEFSSLKAQLSEAKEGLSAAARLGEQLDKKTEIIAGLKDNVAKLSSKLSEAEGKMQSASLNVEGKVDRHLVKNLVLGYFLAPPNNRTEVLRIVATVLDFSQEERGRLGLEPGTGLGGGGWFRSLLHPGGTGEAGNTQSLSEAFVRFLESESRPQPQLRLLPEEQGALANRSPTPSPSSSSASSQRRSPLLLSEVHLPTFGQFPIGRNSSSILKDVLKDS